MFGSFLDGTKHAIEMAVLSNATGLVPDVRGMHFPAADLREIPDRLCLKAKGGILETEGVVEAISSAHPDGSAVERSIRGGLFAVVAAPDGPAIESLASYGEITGMIVGQRSRQAMIYRPQHFVGHEVPFGIARMMVYKTSIGAPIGRISEVVAVAKKPLKAGTILDGEGGYTVYGLIERAGIARDQTLVPIGLTQGAEVIRDIPEDGMVTHADVRLPESFVLGLRKRQDSLAG
jgi:predicted homoserine dehydrogenase-like protein